LGRERLVGCCLLNDDNGCNEQDAALLRDGEVFKPDRLNELGIPTSDEKPYRRTSPLPPLQLIDFPDNTAVESSRAAVGVGAGGGRPDVPPPPPPCTTVDHDQRQVSPVADKIPHVAFLDQHEHQDIEEVDEDQVTLIGWQSKFVRPTWLTKGNRVGAYYSLI